MGQSKSNKANALKRKQTDHPAQRKRTVMQHLKKSLRQRGVLWSNNDPEVDGDQDRSDTLVGWLVIATSNMIRMLILMQKPPMSM